MENIKTSFVNAVNAAMPIITDTLKSLDAADRDADNVAAAIKGGSHDFGSLDDVKETYQTKKQESINRAMPTIETLREKMDHIATRSAEFDPGTVASILPVIQLDGLKDQDYRTIALQNKTNRGVLLAIARAGKGKYASNLAVAFDAYDQAINKACGKAADLAKGTLYKTSGYTTSVGLQTRFDQLAEDIDSAWSVLQDAIEGSVPDSLAAQVLRFQ